MGSIIMDFCFTVIPDDQAFDRVYEVHGSTLRKSILKRLNSLDDAELEEACGYIDEEEGITTEHKEDRLAYFHKVADENDHKRS